MNHGLCRERYEEPNAPNGLVQTYRHVRVLDAATNDWKDREEVAAKDRQPTNKKRTWFSIIKAGHDWLRALEQITGRIVAL